MRGLLSERVIAAANDVVLSRGGLKSNYERLFGTPERAARTLEKGKTLCAWCDKQTCSTSGGECRIYDHDALLDWLRGDA